MDLSIQHYIHHNNLIHILLLEHLDMLQIYMDQQNNLLCFHLLDTMIIILVLRLFLLDQVEILMVVQDIVLVLCLHLVDLCKFS